MAPLIVAGAIVAVGALAQLYNAEKERGANAKRLKEIEDLYDKIKPPNYNLSIMDPPQLHAEEVKKPEFSDPKTAPKFDQTRLKPEDMKLVGKYIPEVAPYIAEEAPKLVERTAGGKSALDAQMKALERYTQISESGDDPIFQQQQQAAARRAQTEAQSRQQSLLQDFARRGQGGSGLSFAAQMGAGADAMDRVASVANEAAADAYTRRLQALSQGASLAGDIGQQDVSLQSRNAGIINDFNERTSGRRQAWEQSRAGALSDANRFNTTMAQDVANQNVGARNKFAVNERDRMDDLTKYTGEFHRRERDRMDDLGKWGYGQDVAQRNYANEIALQRAKWAQGERNTYNDMQSRMHNDDLQKAGLRSGIIHQLNTAGTQRVQDQNAAIGGITSAAASYYGGEAERDYQTERDDKYLKAKYGSQK